MNEEGHGRDLREMLSWNVPGGTCGRVLKTSVITAAVRPRFEPIPFRM
jgi:hypothetical protein